VVDYFSTFDDVPIEKLSEALTPLFTDCDLSL
jgi:hypothetical protein